MDYFIFYIKFQDKIMPIYCLEIEDDPIIEGHTLFKGIKHLSDDAFPKLKVKQISLPKKDIIYYIKGKEVEEESIVSATPKKESGDDVQISSSQLDKAGKVAGLDPNISKRKKRKRGFVRNY